MSGNNNTDPTITLAVICGAFALIGWIVWSVFEEQLLESIRYLRIVEFMAINLLTGQEGACLHWLKIAQTGNVMPTNDAWKTAVLCFGPDKLRGLQPTELLEYYNLSTISTDAIAERFGYYIRWPAIAAMGVMVFLAFIKSKQHLFRIAYNLESFIKVQATMWPVISPIVSFFPAKVSARMVGDTIPDKIPPFAEAFAPEEWISFNRIPVVNGIPDRENTRRAFQAQLGQRWDGFDGLPVYAKALAAACILKGAQKREESDDLLGAISTCWSIKGGLVLTEDVAKRINDVFQNDAFMEKADEIATKFAYRTTSLLGLLKWARFMGGVLAPAQFLWLRSVDRTLWYAMNNLGRRSFHTEGAGAMAHFMAELGAEKALVIPRVETAIVTLNQYMSRTTVKVPKREDPKLLQGARKRKG